VASALEHGVADAQRLVDEEEMEVAMAKCRRARIPVE
jgi:hypothetical protein